MIESEPRDPAFSVTLPEGLTAAEVERILVALLREQERIRVTRRAMAQTAGSSGATTTP
jgi:hypothetical protein